MTLSDLGNLGGFISGIAVACSLIYLAIQIRQGSKIARESLRQSLAENQFAQLTLRATDPVIRTAFRKASVSEELTQGKRPLFWLMQSQEFDNGRLCILSMNMEWLPRRTGVRHAKSC